MKHKQLVKGVIGVHRSAFESGFSMLAAFQDQAGNMMNDLLENAPWLPQESKDAIIGWSGVFRKSREDIRKAVHDGYNKADALLTSGVKSQ
ncbi:MAG: hypothetical protein JXM72_13095 [Deltaproteobacteria bacterium]|nr:hypothetical protein [Deltaproteobacteria bacterium]